MGIEADGAAVAAKYQEKAGLRHKIVFFCRRTVLGTACSCLTLYRVIPYATIRHTMDVTANRAKQYNNFFMH